MTVTGMPGTSYGSATYEGGYRWKVIVPQETTNYVLNPEAFVSTNFTGIGGAIATQDSTYAKYGFDAFKTSVNGDNKGISFTLSTLIGAVTVTMVAVKDSLPPDWDWSVDDTNYYTPTAIVDLDDNWTLYGYSFSSAQATGSTTLYVRQNGAGSGIFYLDGVQVEDGADWTTFCDGEKAGCEWNGAQHASTSTRSGESRAGGLVKDFKIDYGFGVAEHIGWGAARQSVSVGRYAMLPGGELDNIKREPRVATLNGPLRCSSSKDVFERRQDLLRVLAPNSYVRSKTGYQPVRLWYIGAEVVKEIAVHYESGLDAEFKPDDIAMEKISLRFIASDPNWYEIGDSAAQLDTADSDSFTSFMGRLKSTGQWSALGTPAMTASGGSIETYAICRASDGKVYFGGVWLNLEGTATTDRIAYYDPTDDSFVQIVANLNGAVLDIVEGPDGTIYFCGTFTNANGWADADNIAQWDGTTVTAVGTPTTGGAITSIDKMAFAPNGLLYVVGIFTTIEGVANASYVASWNGTAWAAVGQPAVGAVITSMDAIDVDSQNNVYVGGDFTGFAGDACGHWTMWNQTTWEPPFNLAALDSVGTIYIDKQDRVYVGGSFTSANGVTGADNVFMWDGTTAHALGDGTDSTVYHITGAPDGTIYLCGAFSSAGGVDVEYAARWNGASFVHLDLKPAANWVRRIAVGQVDPVVERKYDLWASVAMAAAATFYYAGLTTVTNDGTEIAYPTFNVSRSGGTQATIKTLRNEISGYELFFDYDLRSGETLTVDLDPQAKNVMSSFYGRRLDAVLANSDMGQWQLRPGDNSVTCFVDMAGAPTVVAWLQWRDAYNGLD